VLGNAELRLFGKAFSSEFSQTSLEKVRCHSFLILRPFLG